MKMVMVMVMVIVMLTATSAVAGEARVRWSVLQSLQNSGIVDNVDVKLAMEGAAVEFAQTSAAFKAKVCGARDAYSTDRNLFADAYEEHQSANDKIVRSTVEKLDARLQATGEKASIDEKVNVIAPRTSDKTEEWARELRAGNIDPKPIVDRMCGTQGAEQ